MNFLKEHTFERSIYLGAFNYDVPDEHVPDLLNINTDSLTCRLEIPNDVLLTLKQSLLYIQYASISPLEFKELVEAIAWGSISHIDLWTFGQNVEEFNECFHGIQSFSIDDDGNFPTDRPLFVRKDEMFHILTISKKIYRIDIDEDQCQVDITYMTDASTDPLASLLQYI